ncbi:hypothetical protein RND71_008561 [Anisodus tanguticus]|uniref:Uncharacterized protein n=1 Tax=Anisodus tanguticus TaxID=243964 RepID=A0AAE1VL57_9SOLA|nr:hypothetical protein RND71_008561 [Anisodus tanguticus]
MEENGAKVLNELKESLESSRIQVDRGKNFSAFEDERIITHLRQFATRFVQIILKWFATALYVSRELEVQNHPRLFLIPHMEAPASGDFPATLELEARKLDLACSLDLAQAFTEICCYSKHLLNGRPNWTEPFVRLWFPQSYGVRHRFLNKINFSDCMMTPLEKHWRASVNIIIFFGVMKTPLKLSKDNIELQFSASFHSTTNNHDIKILSTLFRGDNKVHA